MDAASSLAGAPTRGNNAAAAGGLCFEHRGVRGHFDRVRYGADLEADVDGDDLGRIELKIVLHILLEALRGRTNFV